MRLTVAVLCCFVVGATGQIETPHVGLFMYGVEEGDQMLPSQDDSASDEVPLKTQVIPSFYELTLG